MNKSSVPLFATLPLLALLLTTATAAQAGINDLVAFLQRAERMTTITNAVRADVTIEAADGTTDRGVIIVSPTAPSPTGGVFVAIESNGARSLTPLGWSGTALATAATGEKPKPTTVDAPIGGTDLRGIDFFPFWKTDYTSSFISDDNHTMKMVSLYADEGRPYKLFVIAFDKEKMVARSIKYFTDSFNNLVRLRTEDEHVMVGARPLPQHITVEDFEENEKTTYRFKWSLIKDLPAGLLDAGTFASAEVSWPAKAAE